MGKFPKNSVEYTRLGFNEEISQKKKINSEVILFSRKHKK